MIKHRRSQLSVRTFFVDRARYHVLRYDAVIEVTPTLLDPCCSGSITRAPWLRKSSCSTHFGNPALIFVEASIAFIRFAAR